MAESQFHASSTRLLPRGLPDRRRRPSTLARADFTVAARTWCVTVIAAVVIVSAVDSVTLRVVTALSSVGESLLFPITTADHVSFSPWGEQRVLRDDSFPKSSWRRQLQSSSTTTTSTTGDFSRLNEVFRDTVLVLPSPENALEIPVALAHWALTMT